MPRPPVRHRDTQHESRDDQVVQHRDFGRCQKAAGVVPPGDHRRSGERVAGTGHVVRGGGSDLLHQRGADDVAEVDDAGDVRAARAGRQHVERVGVVVDQLVS